MIEEIESEWRETPLTCPNPGCEAMSLYSDGIHEPQCPTCGYIATDAEIYHALTHRTLTELRAEYDANELRRALQHVRGLLAGGRTVGHDHTQAALKAENFIIDLLGVPGGSQPPNDPYNVETAQSDNDLIALETTVRLLHDMLRNIHQRLLALERRAATDDHPAAFGHSTAYPVAVADAWAAANQRSLTHDPLNNTSTTPASRPKASKGRPRAGTRQGQRAGRL